MRVDGITSATELALRGVEAGVPSVERAGESASSEAAAPGVFQAALEGAVSDAAARDQLAAAKVQALAAGVGDDLHGTLISVKEAEISLRLVNSVRTKLLDAFHELWRTNV